MKIRLTVFVVEFGRSSIWNTDRDLANADFARIRRLGLEPTARQIETVIETGVGKYER